MKTILIISPHFPPSNLAAVHRSRLFAQHLPSFGWNPIILTVDENYYEEKLDWNLHSLLPKDLRIEKVKAYHPTKPRIIGDIGLRGFFQLYRKARKLIQNEKIEFLYIPIPSFYVALLGRWLHTTTKIKYGIDYIDPWVHYFPGSDKTFSRHWFSTRLAKFLEPIAIEKASLITGVAEGYYEGVRQRNPALAKTCLFAAMPYGGERMDHVAVKNMQIQPYLFAPKDKKIQLVYAGAMLPKAFDPLERILQTINKNIHHFDDLEIHFIGTGKSPDDSNGYNIKSLAQKYQLWNSIIFEYPARISYLDVLVHLNAVDGIFILGSTEPHYTPSKVYQGVLSKKPIFAVLHSESSACSVIKNAGAGIVLDFDGENDLDKISSRLADGYTIFKTFLLNGLHHQMNMHEFDKFSAKNVTEILANNLNTLFN